MWMPDAYFEQLYRETLDEQEAAREKLDRQARKAMLRAELRRMLGEFAPADAGFAPELLESVDCGDYVRERVKLSGTRGLAFGAYVLLPKSRQGAAGKRPGVLAVHGHGYGSREIVGLRPDGTPDVEPPGIHRHFAVELVRRGLVVIAPDVLGFGERTLAEDAGTGRHSCYKMATQLLLQGKTLTGLRATELRAAFDYLAARHEVDASRLGAMGFSGGALLSFVRAALDERVKATVLTGFPGTFRGTIMAVRHCIDNYLPGMLRHAELPEWIGLLAPRALFVESADADPIFPVASAREAIKYLQAEYERENASARFAHDIFPGAHEISGRQAYDWLAARLSE